LRHLDTSRDVVDEIFPGATLHPSA